MTGTTCAHIEAIDERQAAQGARVRGVRQDRRPLGPPAHLPGMRRHPLLRQLAEPARHQARARDAAIPVMASAEPGERWLYCYPDDAFAEDQGGAPDAWSPRNRHSSRATGRGCRPAV